MSDTTAGFGGQENNVVCKDQGAESRAASTSITITKGSIYANKLNSISWFDAVYEVVIHNNIDGAWQLSGRGTLGHLLDGDGLVVAVGTVAVLCDKLQLSECHATNTEWKTYRIALPILCWIYTRTRSTCGRCLVCVFPVVKLLLVLIVVDALDYFRPYK